MSEARAAAPNYYHWLQVSKVVLSLPAHRDLPTCPWQPALASSPSVHSWSTSPVWPPCSPLLLFSFLQRNANDGHMPGDIHHAWPRVGVRC